MTALLKNLSALTIYVEDVQVSKTFYRTLFGTSTDYEDDVSAVFNLGNTLLNVLSRSEAPALIAPGVVAAGSSGSRVLFSFWLDDIETTCRELTERGIALLNGPIDRPWGLRTACFADPDGHVWEIAQSLASKDTD